VIDGGEADFGGTAGEGLGKGQFKPDAGTPLFVFGGEIDFDVAILGRCHGEAGGVEGLTAPGEVELEILVAGGFEAGDVEGEEDRLCAGEGERSVDSGSAVKLGELGLDDGQFGVRGESEEEKRARQTHGG
jgi:hypothetical protein